MKTGKKMNCKTLVFNHYGDPPTRDFRPISSRQPGVHKIFEYNFLYLRAIYSLKCGHQNHYCNHEFTRLGHVSVQRSPMEYWT